MCYSATASFIAGGLLTVAGAVTLKRAANSAELPFAAVPLLFGIQQIVEGAIWLSFRYDASEIRNIASYIYTLFAYVLWPIYIPIAIGLTEQFAWRRKLIGGLDYPHFRRHYFT